MSFFLSDGVRPGVQLALNDLLVGIGPLVIGLCIVALLITAVWFGRRRSEREPRPSLDPKPRSGAWQTRQEHEDGVTPSGDHGPGHQHEGPRTHESREPQPDEMPQDGRRRMPYEVRDSGVHGGKERTRPRRHSGPNVD